MEYRLEIKDGTNYIDVTKYIIEEPDITQSAEGEFMWLHWLDDFQFTCMSTILNVIGLEEKQRAKIYYNESLVSDCFLRKISKNKKDEEVRLLFDGYDKLLSKVKASLSLYNVSIPYAVRNLVTYANFNLRERGYDLTDIEPDINCVDKIDFENYKSFDFGKVNLALKPEVDEDMVGTEFQESGGMSETMAWAGFFVEIDDQIPIKTGPTLVDWEGLEYVADPLYNAKSGILYGSISVTVARGGNTLISYNLQKVNGKKTEEYYQNSVTGDCSTKKYEEHDLYTIEKNGRIFRWIAPINADKIYYTYKGTKKTTNWKDWQEYIQKLMSNLDNETSPEIIDRDITIFDDPLKFHEPSIRDVRIDEVKIKQITPFAKFAYMNIHIQYAIKRTGETDYNEKNTEGLWYIELSEKDKIGFHYDEVEIGRILKDILIITDSVLYITANKINIVDRKQGRGTVNIEKEDVLEYQEKIRDLEFNEGISFSINKSTGNSEGTSDNGIFILEGKPHDIKGDVIDYYKGLKEDKKKRSVNMEIMNRSKYDDLIAKVVEEDDGQIVEVTPKKETIEIKTKERI